jgi:hypothetical protein
MRSLGSTASLSRTSARRGWSEAESLDWIVASRALAGVIAGLVPFVVVRFVCRSFRGSVARDFCRSSRSVRDRHAPKAPGAQRPPDEWNGCSRGRRSGSCRRSASSRDLSSPDSHRHQRVSHRRGSVKSAGPTNASGVQWHRLASVVRDRLLTPVLVRGVAPASDCGGTLGAPQDVPPLRSGASRS